MLQPHPLGQIPFLFVPYRKYIPQRVDLKFVKVLVYDRVE